MAVGLSVGIDVGSDFSFMTILDSNHTQIGKTFKILHDSHDSLDSAIFAIKKAEEISLKKAVIFLESTGIYHLPLYALLNHSGFDTRIINPLISHSNKNSSIRKVKNDKFDSIHIAELGLNPKTKYSYAPDSFSINIRALSREYYSLVDTRTEFVNKLGNSLRMVFPGYSNVFSTLTGVTSFAILHTYCTPNDILNANKDDLISLVATTSRKGMVYAHSKYDKLIQAATLSLSFSYTVQSQFFIIKTYLSIIDELNSTIDSITEQMHHLLNEFKDTTFAKQVLLLNSIKGVGFLSAVTIMAEIGDFSLFKSPKQLFAYFVELIHL